MKPFSRGATIVGRGASGGDWYISDYNVLDSTIIKGEDVEMRTLITNYETSQIGPVYLDYEFYYNYYGFSNIKTDEWPGHYTGQYVPRSYGEDYPGIKSIDVDIDRHFENDDGHFAFNKGTFWAEKAYAYISGSGTKTRTSTEKSVAVSLGNTHKVFVAAIVYDDISTSTPTSLFSGLESNDMYVVNTGQTAWDTTDFSTYFSTDFILKIIESGDSTGAQNNNKYSWLRDEGMDELGLASDWTDGIGTKSGNHGFDMLVTYIDTGSVSGGGWGWGNMIMISYDGTYPDSWIDSRVMLHEVLHTYMHSDVDIEHLKYTPIWLGSAWNTSYEAFPGDTSGGYIMGGANPTWYLHPDNESRVTSYIDEYDGDP